MTAPKPVVDEALDSVLLVEDKIVTLRDGTKVTVCELTMGQLASIMRAIKPFKARVGSSEDLTLLLLENMEELSPAVAAICCVPPEKLESLKGRDVAKLLEAGLEVNADFFLLQVVPIIPRVLARLQVRIGGLTASISSLAPATAAPKSSG